jgi:hypothetical protein
LAFKLLNKEKNLSMSIHIGKEIEKVLNVKRFKQLDLAQAINTVPSNVKRLLSRESIDTNQLLLISKALDHNFFELYTSNFTFSKGLEHAAFNRPIDDAELKKCQEEKKILEEKYQLQTENAVTLQKYIKLLEEKHGVVKREG